MHQNEVKIKIISCLMIIVQHAVVAPTTASREFYCTLIAITCACRARARNCYWVAKKQLQQPHSCNANAKICTVQLVCCENFHNCHFEFKYCSFAEKIDGLKSSPTFQLRPHLLRTPAPPSCVVGLLLSLGMNKLHCLAVMCTNSQTIICLRNELRALTIHDKLYYARKWN